MHEIRFTFKDVESLRVGARDAAVVTTRIACDPEFALALFEAFSQENQTNVSDVLAKVGCSARPFTQEITDDGPVPESVGGGGKLCYTVKVPGGTVETCVEVKYTPN
jgi:hypothetical protein